MNRYNIERFKFQQEKEEMIIDELTKLMDEFNKDAVDLEEMAASYQMRDLDVISQILWHEAVIYKRCAIKLKRFIGGNEVPF